MAEKGHASENAANASFPFIALGVEFAKDGIAERTGGRRLLFLARERIDSVSLEYGWLSERPIAHTFFGLVLLIPLGLVVNRWVSDGPVSGPAIGYWRQIFVGVLMLTMLGAWTIVSAVKRGHYLVLTSASLSRKIPFHGRLDARTWEAVVSRARLGGYTLVRGLSARVGESNFGGSP